MKYEYLIIGGILIIQLIVFYNVLKRISRLKKFFPPVKNLSIINEEFSLNDELSLRADIIALKEEHNDDFLKTLSSTNSYLVNNKGSAADFNIIRDITERHTATIENIINSTISVPLFLGLAGTFFGIIYGLSFLDFSGGENGVSVITTDSIGSLI